MLKLWQVWQDINSFLNSPEFIDRKKKIGEALESIGKWLKGEDIPIFGATEAANDIEESILEVTKFLESQQVAIPMMASGQDRREYLIELLKIAIPLLFKIL